MGVRQKDRKSTALTTKIMLCIMMFMETETGRQEDKAGYKHGIIIQGMRETLQNLLSQD